MYLSGSQNIMKSMNGLLKIRASEIEAENAYITNINDVQTINGKIGEDIVIDADTGKIIKFKDDVIMDASLNVGGNLDVSQNLIVGNSGGNSYLDTTGTIYIRYPSDPNNIYMRINYEPSLYGFCFTDESIGRIMNFRVKNANGIGYKLFYFAASQLYSEMPVYMNDWCNIASNRTLSFGDANPSLFVGAGIKFVPSAGSGIGDGWKFYCKGFNNNLGYQTLFTHNDLTNTERMTLQMNWSDIRSKVKHTFEQDASFNMGVNLDGNLIGNGNIHCNTFDVSNNSIFNGVSTYNNNIFANNNLHCNTLDVSGNSIFKGTTTLEAITTKAISCTTLTGTGLISTSGNLLVSGTGSNLIFGTTTFNGNTTTGALTCSSLTNNGVGTFANIINQTSTTASNNKITQTRILDDISGQPNMFKYSEFNYKTTGGAGTPNPCIVCREETSFNSMYFFPKLNAGNYNSMVQANDRGIFSFYPNNDNAITITCWGSIRAGLRVSCSSATSGKVEIGAGNNTLYLDNSLGVITHGGAFATATPNFKILNGGQSRGLNFIAFSDSSGNTVNPLISSSDSVITTDTQNNSVLTISPRSTVANGIRMSNTSATNANTDIRCGTSRILFSHSSVVSTIDISSNIVNIPATDAIALTSAENVFTTSGTLNSQKYRANSHLFSMANGTQSGCSVTIGGPITLNRSDTSYNQISTVENLIVSAGATNGGSNYFISGNYTTSNQYYQADNHKFVDRTNNAGLNCNVDVRGNINLTGSSQLKFSDNSIQTTAFTSTKNTKLNDIGTIVTGTLSATTTLTSATIFNCGSMSLTAGTWSVSINCNVSVITGTTSVGQLLAGYSTSATALSQSNNLAIINCGLFNYGVGNQWVLTSTNTIVVSSTTTYYMICECVFGTANRFQFGGNSAFQATKIA
jgi:hypothetical protein